MDITHKFNNFNMGQKLFVGFGIVSLLFISVVCLFHLTLLKTLSDYKTVNLFDQKENFNLEIKISLLEARKAEKEFLMHKNLKEVDKVNFLINEIKTQANHLKKLESISNNAEGINSVQQIVEQVDYYHKKFTAATNSLKLMGLDNNSGLQGEFRKATHKLEGFVNENGMVDLMAAILMLRRYEKDYLLRSDIIHKKNHDELMVEIKNYIDILKLEKKKKAVLKQYILQYKEVFDRLVNIDQKTMGLIKEMQEAADKIEPLILFNVEKAALVKNDVTSSINKASRTKSTVAIIISFVTICICVVIAFLITASVTKPVVVLNTAINKVAQGDLNQKVDINTKDEIGSIASVFNNMVKKLREMTAQVKETADNIAVTTTEITATTLQQTNGAHEQSIAITQTTATIDELRQIAAQNEAKAKSVLASSQETFEISQVGQKAVNDCIDSMINIKEKVELIAENILALSEKSQEIGKIISSVKDIAEQSNLLALNASIEAARAGESGKGFAVVAMEVKNLAEQSRQATTQVKRILNDIQKATNSAVMVTEEGSRGVDKGVHQVSQAGSTINQLSQSIMNSSQISQEILVSANKQSLSIDQILDAIQNIKQVSIESLSGTQQTMAAAENLSTLAKNMEDLLEKYKLN